MQIHLSSGNYDIVSCGQAYLFDKDKDLTIHVESDNGFAFSVVLKFLEDHSGRRSMEQEASEDEIILSCMNFEDNGAGLVSPSKIAVIQNKEVYLMFWSFVDGENKKVRSVRYTIFYEK